MLQMSAFDLIFLVILSIFVLIGIWKGFFREVLGLVGIVAGVFFAIIGFAPLSKLLNNLIPGIPSPILVFLSFAGIFVGIYLLSRLLAGFLSKLSSLMLLGWLNRFLGGVIGGLKGAIFISLFLMLLGFFPFQGELQKVRKGSLLYEPLQRFVPMIYNVFSDFSFSSRHFEQKMTDLVKDLQGRLNGKIIDYFFYKND
jgi:membrane protein required for colicin V production